MSDEVDISAQTDDLDTRATKTGHSTELQMYDLISADNEMTEGGVAAIKGSGSTVMARSEARLVLRRFLRHRAAMVGLVVFVLIVILAFTSVGWGPIPGWWKYSYSEALPLVN